CGSVSGVRTCALPILARVRSVRGFGIVVDEPLVNRLGVGRRAVLLVDFGQSEEKRVLGSPGLRRFDGALQAVDGFVRLPRRSQRSEERRVGKEGRTRG